MRKPAWAFCLWVFGSVTTNPDTRTRGQRWADAVTSFGGSWLFIGTFVGSSAVWVLWNIFGHSRPDPYPFLFLNMLLTVISTFQQPFVLLSQNRQNEEDRVRDEEDRAQLRLLIKRLDSIEAKLDMRCNCCAICNTTPCDAGLHG